MSSLSAGNEQSRKETKIAPEKPENVDAVLMAGNSGQKLFFFPVSGLLSLSLLLLHTQRSLFPFLPLFTPFCSFRRRGHYFSLFSPHFLAHLVAFLFFFRAPSPSLPLLRGVVPFFPPSLSNTLSFFSLFFAVSPARPPVVSLLPPSPSFALSLFFSQAARSSSAVRAPPVPLGPLPLSLLPPPPPPPSHFHLPFIRPCLAPTSPSRLHQRNGVASSPPPPWP